MNMIEGSRTQIYVSLIKKKQGVPAVSKLKDTRELYFKLLCIIA
jgi:hypothetical protein